MLFRDAPWSLILENRTPTWTPGWRWRCCSATSGARPVPTTAAEQDAAIARVIGLPHMLAEALALTGLHGGELGLSLAAGSYTSGSRVARTRPELVATWCDGNQALVAALDDAIAWLTDQPGPAGGRRFGAAAGRGRPPGPDGLGAPRVRPGGPAGRARTRCAGTAGPAAGSPPSSRRTARPIGRAPAARHAPALILAARARGRTEADPGADESRQHRHDQTVQRRTAGRGRAQRRGRIGRTPATWWCSMPAAPSGSALGDPDQVVFPRSSLKPVQAVGMLRAGLGSTGRSWRWPPPRIPARRSNCALIEAMLAEAGLAEDDLDCPPDLPIGLAERRAYLAAGQSERRLAMNCSGKHTAMLLTCLARRLADVGLPGPDAPAAAARWPRTVAELAGEPIAATGGGRLRRAAVRDQPARRGPRLPPAGHRHGPERQVADAMPQLSGAGGRRRAAPVTAPDARGPRPDRQGRRRGRASRRPCPTAARWRSRSTTGRLGRPTARSRSALRHLGVDRPAAGRAGPSPVLGGGEPVGSIRPVAGQ